MALSSLVAVSTTTEIKLLTVDRFEFIYMAITICWFGRSRFEALIYPRRFNLNVPHMFN